MVVIKMSHKEIWEGFSKLCGISKNICYHKLLRKRSETYLIPFNMILHLVLVAYKFTVASNFGISFGMDNFSRNVFFGKHLFFDFKRLKK